MTLPIRSELIAAETQAWSRLAAPGTWCTGADRVAIAAETRHARSCRLCAARRDALSPLAVTGRHDTLGALTDAEVEAIHRIATDPGRLGKTWFERLRAAGLADERYVEIVALVAISTSLDTFRFGAGLPELELPPPLPGAPSLRRPARAKQEMAWMHTLVD